MKFILDNIFLICAAVASGLSLALPVVLRRGKKVTHLQATLLINKEQAAIVDVRDPKEFAAGHLHKAKNIPLGQLASRLKELEKAKSGQLIVVCESGVQSSRGAAILHKAGFEHAHSLDGGMKAWSAANLPITKE